MKDGRRDIFEKIYNEKFDDIYRYVSHRLPNQWDAEDITADIFIALYYSLDSVDLQKINNYLFGIARHKVLSFLRHTYRLKVSVDLNEEFEDFQEEPPNTRTPRDPKIGVLNKLISQLSEREKLILELKYHRNLTFSDIGKELNITRNNVKVMHHRLIKKLRTLWEKMI